MEITSIQESFVMNTLDPLNTPLTPPGETASMHRLLAADALMINDPELP